MCRKCITICVLRRGLAKAPGVRPQERKRGPVFTCSAPINRTTDDQKRGHWLVHKIERLRTHVQRPSVVQLRKTGAVLEHFRLRRHKKRRP